MPSRVRSIPISRFTAGLEVNQPGTIVDIPIDSKPRHSHFHHNRRSTDYSIRSSRSSKSSQESLVTSHASLSIQVESPPVVCYGPPTASSGAIISGQLWTESLHADLVMESLKLTFRSVHTTKKPVTIGCADCATKITDLHTWEFIAGVHPLSSGRHNFPYSYLIPGNMAASTDSVLGKITYQLIATGITHDGQLLEAVREVKVSRAVLQGEDRHSLRVFPPTSLSANLELPSVIHRGGQFPISMRLEGVTIKENNTRWRLRKIVWRLEEKAKIVSPACKAHAYKIGGEGKGLQYEDIKVLDNGEFKNGWKCDFSGDGKIEFEFNCGIPAGIPATDDVENASGLTVTHSLVLEMIVAEEYIP